MVNAVSIGKFGIAFCEASGACKIRSEGNDNTLKSLAEKNAKNIGAGHTFIIFMKDCYPLNVLNAIKNVRRFVRFSVLPQTQQRLLLRNQNKVKKSVGEY